MAIEREVIGNKTVLSTELLSPVRIAQEGYDLLKATLLKDFENKVIYSDKKGIEVSLVKPRLIANENDFEDYIGTEKTFADILSVGILFKKKGEILDEVREDLIKIPALTDRGSFVYNGKEKILVNQEEPDGMGIRTAAHLMYSAINDELSKNIRDFTKGFSIERYFTEKGNPKKEFTEAKDNKKNLIYSLSMSDLFKGKYAQICKRNNIISTINDVNSVALADIQEMTLTDPEKVKSLDINDRYKTVNTGRNRLNLDGGGRYATDKRTEGANYRYKRTFSSVCKVDYPEGLKKPARILAPYYKVKDGKVDTSKVLYMSIEDEFDHTICDISCIDENGNLKDGRFNAIRRADMVIADKKNIEYVYASLYQNEGGATALNVMPERTAKARKEIASNQQAQVTPICTPEDFKNIRRIAEYLEAVDPRTAARYKAFLPEEGQEYRGENARVISRGALEYAKLSCKTSKFDGTVIAADENLVQIRDNEGKVHDIKIQHGLNQNNNAFVDYRTTVKEGDVVKKGDILAENRDVINGEICTGLPALTCYLAMGSNMEDAVLVSESFAKKLWTPHTRTFSFSVPVKSSEYGAIEKVNDDRYENGIIKVGSIITKGDVLAKLKTAKGPHDSYEDWMKQKDIDFKNTPVVVDRRSWIAGIVTGIEKSKPITTENGTEIIVNVKTQYYKSPAFGNKMCGQLGNKFTMSVVPDENMPKIVDKMYKGTVLENRVADMILSPTSLMTRNDFSRLFVGELGIKALLEDKYYTLDPNTFDSKDFESLGGIVTEMNGNKFLCGYGLDNYYIVAEKTSKDVEKVLGKEIDTKEGILESKVFQMYNEKKFPDIKNLKTALALSQKPDTARNLFAAHVYNDSAYIEKASTEIEKQKDKRLEALHSVWGSKLTRKSKGLDR